MAISTQDLQNLLVCAHFTRRGSTDMKPADLIALAQAMIAVETELKARAEADKPTGEPVSDTDGPQG